MPIFCGINEKTGEKCDPVFTDWEVVVEIGTKILSGKTVSQEELRAVRGSIEGACDEAARSVEDYGEGVVDDLDDLSVALDEFEAVPPGGNPFSWEAERVLSVLGARVEVEILNSAAAAVGSEISSNLAAAAARFDEVARSRLHTLRKLGVWRKAQAAWAVEEAWPRLWFCLE